MGRVSQDEERAIREAVGVLRRVDLGRDGLPDDLERIVEGLNPPTVEEVPGRANKALDAQVPWTSGNEASKTMALRIHRKVSNARGKLMSAFLNADWTGDKPGFTNHELYRRFRGYSEYTINRAVSRFKRHGLLEECGTRKARDGKTLMTAHRPSKPVRDYLDGDQRGLF